MTIKRDGVLCKIAYGYKESSPGRISLCKLFWRVIWSAIVVWPIRMVAIPIYALAISIGAIAIGYRPGWLEGVRGKGNFVRIPYLYKFPPIVLFGLWWIVHSILISIHVGLGHPSNRASQATVVILSVILAIAVIMLITWLALEGIRKLIFKRSYSESAQMIKAYLKARKDKVCPIVEIK